MEQVLPRASQTNAVGASAARRRRSALQPPTTDKRWKLVDVAMRRQGHSADALIETLHTVQDCFGYLDEASLRYVAQCLGLPLSKVYGVATFYHLFTLKPPGEHTCVVCTGTACYIKGGRRLLDGISSRYNVSQGHTTDDGFLSVLTARCLGTCGMAPAAVLDGRIMGELTPEDLLAEIEGLS